ncbi:hypothetical protein HPC49_36665 [Pyxidicoccus fallax]|uniref:Uncharacterized protein n=1 Tax=Pyxidicoccus fallax TaxID=394095 RepID=A0A848LSX7_9BACT|nr:hypothetical protein [Pyxidicoccus fallax]NMO20876.1 hypothetical protein [Pyxidicoccus fallax]NPC83740.1 hypothetical protein [Pyxidicoccus fallax]
MSRMNRMGLVGAVLLLAAGTAEAKQWKYAGMHPRGGQPSDGLCHIEATHVHTAAPIQADVLYRTHDGAYVFIGDPTPFGYEGTRHAYYGHHPVVLNVLINIEVDVDVVEYCYHDGPHYHAYEPPPRHDFEEQEDVHYYTGEYPEEYKRESPQLVRVNTVYRTWNVPRPVVTVAPPSHYRGPIFQVNVNVSAPKVEVNVGAVPARHDVIIVHEHDDDDCDHPGHKHKHKHKKHKHKKFKERH